MKVLRVRRWSAALAALVTTSALAVALGSSPAAAAGGTGTGYLHTSGNKIVDSTGATVRLTGINWFGMETDNKTFHGLWAEQPRGGARSTTMALARLQHPPRAVLRRRAQARRGRDRHQRLHQPRPGRRYPAADPRQGHRLRRAARACGSSSTGTARPPPGSRPSGTSPRRRRATWIADWKMLAQRYAGNTTVIGADLHNEPHAEGTNPAATGACWGCGDTTRDWRLAAERAGNAVLSVNPNWLIFVEGVSCPSGGLSNVWDNDPSNDEDCGWWGGNLSKAGQFPVRLNVANRLVYSPHEYATSVFHQTWFDDPNYPANMPAIWDKYWGYLYKQNIAPIMMGEFGTTLPGTRGQGLAPGADEVHGHRGERHVVHLLVVEPQLRRHRRHRQGRLDHDQPGQAGHPPALPDPAGRRRDGGGGGAPLPPRLPRPTRPRARPRSSSPTPGRAASRAS